MYAKQFSLSPDWDNLNYEGDGFYGSNPSSISNSSH
jgi:hypothetical protein